MNDGLFPPPGGGDGYMLTPGVHGRIARRLDAASDALDAKAAGMPPAPDAGICSALVAAGLGLFCNSLGDLVEGLNVYASTVAHNRQVYENAEGAAKIVITPNRCGPAPAP
ncbi:hypothetical protein DPM19_29570 [Actinomadura craniellae]|uniref:Uncharacterized protein n=1 Tax=Actinomadura craniellae TaxID=2231787 RepID=A0A365GXA3_9ACTN|nr:hypothetical protein [Actinomadura craniellae]RAY11461.1 hypothetical protein DPM19_29570 [Actinomadura craniellae]